MLDEYTNSYFGIGDSLQTKDGTVLCEIQDENKE